MRFQDITRFSLFRLGEQPDMEIDLRRVLTFSNFVYVLLALILLIFIGKDLLRYGLEPGTIGIVRLIPISLFGVCGFCLWLNHLKWYTISKSIFLVTWTISTNALVPVVLGGRERDFMIVPVFAITASVLVHVLFSYTRERPIYWIMVVATWLNVLFCFDYIAFLRLPDDPTRIFPNGMTNWRMITSLTAVFLNGMMVFVIRLNNQILSSLAERNRLISAQNHKLELQQRELGELTTQLEEKVKERTHQLQAQNQRLREYVFFNSHVLRAPVSRIQGLINLLKHPLDREEEKKITGLIDESMKELDTAIRSANENLEQSSDP
jgi:signal transduction histidine kinase